MRNFVVVLLIVAGGAVPARASSLVTLATFSGTNGAQTKSSLIADASGDLFGTTEYGGTSGDGTVFEITRTGTTYSSPITLAAFNDTNGGHSFSSLVADPAGNLFGATEGGGSSGDGTIFEIAKTGGGYGSLNTLAALNGANGAQPYAGLITDTAGDLFGTTYGGGTSGVGTVFEIEKTGNSYGSPITLATFNDTNGANPFASLMADASGNLFGTTYVGGSSSDGTVFEIAKTGNTYGSPITLATFSGTNGANPYFNGLAADAAGNLFGTRSGGGASGFGTVFEIAKAGNSYGSLTTLASFNNINGNGPYDGLIVDAAGNLFGTTAYGGTSGDGTVFEVANVNGTYGPPTTLATFNGTNGTTPVAGLIADGAGDLFGTTAYGGTSDDGTVFEITGSGFVAAQTSTSVPEPDSIALLGAPFVASVLVSILSRHRHGRT